MFRHVQTIFSCVCSCQFDRSRQMLRTRSPEPKFAGSTSHGHGGKTCGLRTHHCFVPFCRWHFACVMCRHVPQGFGTLQLYTPSEHVFSSACLEALRWGQLPAREARDPAGVDCPTVLHFLHGELHKSWSLSLLVMMIFVLVLACSLERSRIKLGNAFLHWEADKFQNMRAPLDDLNTWRRPFQLFCSRPRQVLRESPHAMPTLQKAKHDFIIAQFQAASRVAFFWQFSHRDKREQIQPNSWTWRTLGCSTPTSMDNTRIVLFCAIQCYLRIFKNGCVSVTVVLFVSASGLKETS